jgi:N-acetylglucosaminyldiphosphoundecaprenol N-acetyl-beta-D-mannosaminyltransferase
MDESLTLRCAPSANRLPTACIDAVTLHRVTEAQCIAHILDELDAARGGWLVSVNVDHLRLIRSDPTYGALCARADLRVADGMPLVWASRLRGAALPARVAGATLLSSLSAAAAHRGRSIFLLGGAPGTAQTCAAVLRAARPELRVAGTLCPNVPLGAEHAAVNGIAPVLQAAAPDIVFVALGKPKQERVIDQLRDALPRAWLLGVGISFSFLAGELRRAPPVDATRRLGVAAPTLARARPIAGALLGTRPAGCDRLARSCRREPPASGGPRQSDAPAGRPEPIRCAVTLSTALTYTTQLNRFSRMRRLAATLSLSKKTRHNSGQACRSVGGASATRAARHKQ